MNTYVSEKQERFFFYNSLAILLKSVEGERTTVDLRNESSVYGIVEQADGFMNIIMKDCMFTDPRGDNFKFEIFFVQARNIRYVHIPSHIRIIPSIKEQLMKLNAPPVRKLQKHSAKSKRAQTNQARGLAAVNAILKNKESNEPKPSGSHT